MLDEPDVQREVIKAFRTVIRVVMMVMNHCTAAAAVCDSLPVVAD